MFVIYGFYRFGQKRVGYRNDFCLTCKSESLAEQWRSFNCGHLFFVPLIPFGFVNRWLCPVCKNDPHIRFGSRSFRILLTSVFGFVTLIPLIGLGFYYFSPPRLEDVENASKEGPGIIWAVAGVFGSIFACLLAWTLRYSDESLYEQLRLVKPARLDVCPYCDQRLNDEGFCGACQLKRYDVNDLRR